ncbi:MAG: major facilitator superfamily protein [Jatrophihabitantaceae bacterium]|nr:major facilitator superfamily protein [Jatrophihabitantaceae bacterium]
MRNVDGDAQPARSSRTGWTMVAAVFVILTTLNGLTFYSMSAYIDALVDERGMSLTLASSGPTVSSLVSGASGLLVARLIGVVPIRVLLAIGASGTACGLVAIGASTQAWQLWASFALFGASSAWTSAGPCSALVARWFPDSPARPLAIAMTGLSAGGAFVPPIALALIDRHGVAAASRTIALAMLVIVGLIALIIREAPAPPRRAADAGDARPARASFRDRSFTCLFVGFGVIMLAQLGTGTHLVRLARENGIAGAALAVSAMAICSFGGRLGAIPVLAALGLRRFTMVLGVVQITALLTLSTASSQVHLVVGAAMLGATTGNFIFLGSLYCIEAYGLADYPRMFARVNLSSPLGAGAGPLVIGVMATALGGYGLTLALMAVISATGTTLLVASGVDSARRARPRPVEVDAQIVPAAK